MVCVGPTAGRGGEESSRPIRRDRDIVVGAGAESGDRSARGEEVKVCRFPVIPAPVQTFAVYEVGAVPVGVIKVAARASGVVADEVTESWSGR